VLAAFSAALFAFTVANLAIGVALAPRYAEASPDAPYGNNLAQQITSTFDVVVCLVSLTILVTMLCIGPLAGYFGRRRDKRAAAVADAPVAEPPTTAVPTMGQPVAPPTMPRIVRRQEHPTTAIPAPATEQFAAPTTALRIQRRETPSDATTQIPKPPPES
jgi:hypothetical protein